VTADEAKDAFRIAAAKLPIHVRFMARGEL
jgi:ribosomal protein L16/L10AE